MIVTPSEVEAIVARNEHSNKLFDWLVPAIWWHYGLATGLAGGAIWMMLSGCSLWSCALFWTSFVTWRIRGEIERAQILEIAKVSE